MRSSIGAVFSLLFAAIYIVITHFFFRQYTDWITQLNYGLIIGSLFWFMLNMRIKE